VKDVVDLFDSFIVSACSPENERFLHCLLRSTIKRMQYWRRAVDNVTTWTVHKFKFLVTRNLIRMLFRTHSVHSNNNPSDTLKTLFVNGLAYRSL
jgi:uncharacterized membrane protein